MLVRVAGAVVLIVLALEGGGMRPGVVLVVMVSIFAAVNFADNLRGRPLLKYVDCVELFFKCTLKLPLRIIYLLLS
tara:strand:- start:1578 stop:1805 length:228 start_codon:yes stop_codon:yes gene_type:complete